MLLHQHPLQIPKWTVYQDARWKQEESYQSHHSLSSSLPKSWRSSRIKEKKAQLTTSPALFSSWYTQFSVDLLNCYPFSTEKLPLHNPFYCSFTTNQPTKQNSLSVSTFLCCISALNLTENSSKVMYLSVSHHLFQDGCALIWLRCLCFYPSFCWVHGRDLCVIQQRVKDVAKVAATPSTWALADERKEKSGGR